MIGVSSGFIGIDWRWTGGCGHDAKFNSTGSVRD